MTTSTFAVSVSRALRVVTRLNSLAADLSSEIQRKVQNVSAFSQVEEQPRKRREENKELPSLLDKYRLIQHTIADVRARVYAQNTASGVQEKMAKLETLNAEIKLFKTLTDTFHSGVDFEDLPAQVTGSDNVYRHRETVFTVERSQREQLKESLRFLQASHNRLSDDINTLNAQKMEIILDKEIAKNVGLD